MAIPADTSGMEVRSSEAGFGLIELLISMVVLQVALLAIVGTFGAGAVALGRAGKINTAAVLADQQMELYRTMSYDAIGLDTASAPSSGTYTDDISVCAAGQTPTCANTGPRNNANTATWSCTAASGATSVSTYFSANGVNPCTAHRQVTTGTTPASPDDRSYYVDTYITWGTLLAGQRQEKQVSIVVRDGTSALELAKEVGTFDCSTGNPANSAPC
ncbi:MAG TPA: type II secretion system protein [Gaiellaceae bacterium]